MTTYYALQNKKYPTVFICVSNSREQFARKIDRTYWNWRGIQSKDAKPTLDDFLDAYNKVKLTVEEVLTTEPASSAERPVEGAVVPRED